MKSLLFLIIILLLKASDCRAQSIEFNDTLSLAPKSNYENDIIPADIYKVRREKYRSLMRDSSVALVFASSKKNRNSDVDYEFHQNADFYYLTGIREPDAILVIYKNKTQCDSIIANELIFIKKRDSKQEMWNGGMLDESKVIDISGVEQVFGSDNFPFFNFKWKQLSLISTNLSNLITEDNISDSFDSDDLAKTFIKELSDLHLIQNSEEFNKIMATLRQNKEAVELVLIKKACDISCNAFLKLMKELKPGMHEFNAEAILEYHFKANGAEFEGYPSICGANENSTVLHYSKNRRLLNDGDILIADAGAEYHGYTADITRTLPVNGKFSEEQRIIYNIVLEAQIAGISVCRKGANFWEAHKAATAVIKKRLLEYGVIKEEKDYLRYFMHGTSHYLGLDVHDAGLYQKLEPGQVITVEPGIYIKQGSPCDPKWWNISVRIEDDILITDGSPEILSSKAPKKIEEIERLMQQGK